MSTQNFYVAVHAIIKAENQALALHKSKVSDGTDVDLWTLPGGKLDEGESEIPALKRELQEELDFDEKILNIKFLNYYIPGGRYKNGNKLLSLMFEVEVENIFEPTLSEEHDKFIWLPWEEYLELEFHIEKTRLADMLKN